MSSSSHTCGYAVGLGSIVVGLCLIPLAVARPAGPAKASPAPRIVLLPADAPGLRPVRAAAASGPRAVAAALRPARVPPLRGDVQVSHFTRRGADLWSLAVVLKSRSAAAAQTSAFAAAARRGGLRPARAGVGEQSWSVARRGAAVVAWRRQNAVGEILLAARLRPAQLGQTAVQYATVADARMADVLGRDAWDRALARIPANGKISKKLALDLFAIAYGALPGTTAPAGPAGQIPDGTLAAYSVLARWEELSAEQQAAAARVLGIKGVAARRTSGGASGARRTGYVDPGDPTFVERPDLEKIANGFVTEYAKHLGPLALTVVVGTSQMGNALAEALPIDDGGNVSDPAHYCRIRLEPAGQKLKSPSPELNYVIAHEVFHCYQAAILGAVYLVKVATPTRPWLIEGSAVWAGMTVSPLPWTSEKNWMKNYVPTVGLELFARAYTAVGFFGHAEEATGDLWSRIKSILLAPGNEAAYSAAGGYSPQFVNSWGSSTFAKPKLGPDWTFTSPISPPGSFVAGSAPLVGDDVLYAGVHAFQRYTLDLAAMRQIDPKLVLLHLVRQRGWARLANPDFDLTNVVDDWFWIGEGEPKCPQGTEGTPPPATVLTSDPSLALTGGADGAVVSVKLVSLDDYCKLKQEPPKPPQGPPAGGGGGGGGCDSCGSSNGDPHLHTFDGVFYDFQGAGEYTLARSRSGDLEVQAREQQYPGSPDVAVNTAIAVRVGGSRVEVDRGDPLLVRLNGLGLQVTAKPRLLPGGGRVRLVVGQVELTWPDGSLARIWSVGSWGVAALIKPAVSRRGTLTGLLGNFDGNPDNDFTTRSGRRLDPLQAPGVFRLLYRVLGDGWRVSQRQSLFAYARGQSTRTFTNRAFPHRLTSAAGLSADQRRRALRFCRALHITNTRVFDSCLLDVGLTANGAFVTTSAQLERTAGGFAKPGRATRPAKPVKPATPAKPSKGEMVWTRLAGTVGGRISTANAGGKVVIAYRSGQGSAEALSFTPSTARDATAPVRSTITSGWSSIGDPFVLERAGGGLQVLLTGIHGGNNDPLNGVSFAPRNADGSFGPPVPATGSTYAEFVTGTATLAPDGAPLWAADRGGTLWLWRGATASAGVDLSATAGGAVDAATVGHDRSGRYWLAWHTAFSSDPKRVGLYLVQFDPVALKLVGSPQQAPGSADRGYGSLALPCGASCRLVYVQPHKLGGARIVSWAAGDRAPATAADFGVGHGIGDPAAAFTARGRLWIAWWDNTGRADYGFRAVRGDARGAGGLPFRLGRPSGSTNSQISVVGSGESLVAVTTAGTGQPYVDVVAPR